MLFGGPCDTFSLTQFMCFLQIKRKTLSLQEYFDDLLAMRGYGNAKTHETLATGYHQEPTELQLASYGPKTLRMVKDNDAAGLYEALNVAGLSPNACNAFGESIVHMACRRGHSQILRVLVESGAVLKTCDDYGRTPLHDACWSAQPSFDTVEQIAIDCDRCMWFLRDCRGSLPLSYVHEDNIEEWKDWFDSRIDVMFPSRHEKGFLISRQARGTDANTNTRTINEQPNWTRYDEKVIRAMKEMEPLPLQLIQMVANGSLSPREARVLADTRARGDEETEADTLASDDYDGDSSSYYSSDDEDDDDLVELLRGIAY